MRLGFGVEERDGWGKERAATFGDKGTGILAFFNCASSGCRMEKGSKVPRAACSGEVDREDKKM